MQVSKNMTRHWITLLFIVAFIEAIGQPEINVVLTVSDSATNSGLLHLSITNSSKKSYVLGLQNWQIIDVPKSSPKPVWAPVDPGIINFLYVIEDSTWNPNRLYYVDWEIIIDSVKEGSLKLLKPGQTFEVFLQLNDSLSRILSSNKDRTTYVAYLFSIAPYRYIKRKIGLNSKVFFQESELMIRDLEINYNFMQAPSMIGPKLHNPNARFAEIDFTAIEKLFKRQIVYQRAIQYN